MKSLPEADKQAQTADFLAGGGRMGALMRALDWSTTPLGPIASWPQSLKTSVSICLNSSFALLVWWSKDLVMLYNDAYCPLIGDKHPRALGQAGQECWPEIWDIIGPMLHGVLETGKATRSDDLFLPLERHGYAEECYFTFSYSPIRDETGGVGGVFTPVQETTEKVIGERRLRTLRDLAAQSIQAKEEEEVCRITAETLAQNPYDLPFTCVYLLNNERSQARLAGTSGIETGTAISPAIMLLDSLDEGAPLLPLKVAAGTGRAQVIQNAIAQFGPLPKGAWATPPEEALVLPIILPGNVLPGALLVAAVSPMKALDSAYQSFFELVTGQVAATIAEARAFVEERKRAEALAELDRAKTTFFSNVSHEFRTPITLILGQLDALLAKPEGGVLPENREALATAQRNGLRLLKLVNMLLDFSRIEAGRVRAVYEPTDISAYTVELASVFQSAIEKAGMRFLVDCPPLSQPLYIDREMWEKIVLNLLSNAFKFTEAGEIEVLLEEKGDCAQLSVRDTGAGIPVEQLPHIFERFHRVEGTRARTHEGTGIGLALVQELVKLHGGNVEVKSHYGQGSTFTVALPFGSAHLPQEQIQTGQSSSTTENGVNPYVTEALHWLPDSDHALVEPALLRPAPTSSADLDSLEPAVRNRIVLADDNADMRAYVSGLLRPSYDVIAVPNGKAVLQVLQESLPDLILSDIMMPEMDGYELLHRLRSEERTRTLPVILLSARAGQEEKVAGFTAHADDYLTKPFSAHELLARVASHLEMARVRKQAAQALEARAREIEALNVRLKRAIRETHHRVKNNLQIISAMVEMQMLEHQGAQMIPLEDYKQLKAHIHTLAIVHDLLSASAEDDAGQRISVKAVIEQLLPMLQQTAWNKSIRYAIDEVSLTSKLCVSLALILNELVTNAFKHGKNNAEVLFRVEGSEATLEVVDDGPGFPPGFDALQAANLGLELVESLVRTDLKGRSIYSNLPAGGGCVRIVFPLPRE